LTRQFQIRLVYLNPRKIAYSGNNTIDFSLIGLTFLTGATTVSLIISCAMMVVLETVKEKYEYNSTIYELHLYFI
jgi:hypothetical protein